MFDCFFDETFARLERSGLKSRQKRRDVIDHLNAIILGGAKGSFIVRVALILICSAIVMLRGNRFD